MTRVHDVGIREVDDDFATRWRDLAENTLEPSPFAEPDFHLHAASAWPGGDHLRLLATSDDQGRLGVVIPYVAASYELRGLRIATASTHDDYLTRYVGGCYPLVRASDPVAHIGALLHGLGRGGRPPALALAALPQETLGADFLEAARAAATATVEVETEPRWMYPALPADESLPLFDAPAMLSSGHRRTYRKRVAALAEAVGDSLRIEDWSQRPDAATAFVDFQSKGWKADPARGGDGLALHPARRAAFERILEAFSQRDRLRVMAVCGGDEVLYVSVNLGAAAGGWFGFYDAFSEEHARLSPGVVGRHAVMRSLRQGDSGEPFDPRLPMGSAAAADGGISVQPTSQILMVRSGARARGLITLMNVRRRLHKRGASTRPESAPLRTTASSPGPGESADVS